jgi:hypothetical protein
MSIDPAGPKRAPRESVESQPRRRSRRSAHWMVAGSLVLATAAGLALSACASGYTRPLVSRGLPAEERKDYIIQNGFGIPENIKQAFLDGYVEVGMTREMVFQLYGAPDRTTGGDTNWEYVNNKGNIITGITFKGDKVEKVYGDPRGGSPPGNQAAN